MGFWKRFEKEHPVDHGMFWGAIIIIETSTLIAYEQLGSVNYTDRLMNLNRQYRDIYIFPSGVVLTLPKRETKINSSLPPWKRKGAGM